FEPFVNSICNHYADLIGATRAIAELQARLGNHRVVVRGMIALAAAVPPPDPPELPRPKLDVARWLPPEGGPSTAFRQSFVVPGTPLGSSPALARREGGAWQTRHEPVKLFEPATPQSRAKTILLGTTRERAPLVPTGLITDVPLEVGLGNRYRFALADLF